VPEYAKAWLVWRPSWQAFQTDFLKLWGGRYGPSLKTGKWWLWITSIYLHRDLQHIVSNMLLFVSMSVHLELNYGWWRLLLVWVMSGAPALLRLHIWLQVRCRLHRCHA
jgi:membrane associated rhomboid family serine protease